MQPRGYIPVLRFFLLPYYVLLSEALSPAAWRRGDPAVSPPTYREAVLAQPKEELGHLQMHGANETPATGGSDYRWRMKVYYVNVDASIDRNACAARQLKDLSAAAAAQGISIDYARFPAVTFNWCTNSSSCMQERPLCFPSGKVGYIHHGLTEELDGDAKAHMVRGVLGNWCSHLWAIEGMTREMGRYDFFLILEDDVILLPHFLDSLSVLFNNHPHHWDLIALDTFTGAGPSSGTLPHADRFDQSGNLPLYTISQSMNSYWGAHAWLLSTQTIVQFYGFMRQLPAVPLDWVPKATRPLHRGFWAYQPGAILQRESAPKDALQNLSRSCINQQGSDIAVQQRSFSHLNQIPKPVVVSAPISQTNRVPREIVVLGLYESGTKLLVDFLERNLAYPDGRRACKDYAEWAFCGQTWKHTYPRRLEQIEALRRKAGFGNFSEAVAVVIVRHPFAQLRSMSKRQKDVSCGAGKWSRCKYREPSRNEFPAKRAEIAPCTEEGQKVNACWSSTVEAWSSYMRAYRQLEKAGIFHKTLILRYEDVVEAPWAALVRVSRAAEVPMAVRDVRCREEPIGFATGGLLSHTNALKKLATNDYNETLTCSEMHGMCDKLDKEMMKLHGYRGCDKAWPGFDELIYNGNKYTDVSMVRQLFNDAPEDVCDPHK